METIFLAGFVFGALFTLLSVVLGFAGHGVSHISGGHGDLGGAHGHLGDAHGHAASAHGAHDHSHPSGTLPLLSVSAAVGALTWFGAAGYLLLRLGALAVPVVIIGALLGGAAGWYLVARFLGLILAGERVMDPEDYRLEGTVGRVTVRIPAGGTGEVVFSMAGARRSEAARAVDGVPIPRGSEVVITAYADGFATVQPWGDFLAAHDNIAARERKEA
jgi:hypothetical protein